MGPRRKRETPRRRSATPAPGPSGTPRRQLHRRRNVWLKEVRKLQKSTDLLLRKRPFSLLPPGIKNCSEPGPKIKSQDSNGNEYAMETLEESLSAIQSLFCYSLLISIPFLHRQQKHF
ncbi:histone H3-like centromeric protein A isoform X2 [Nannospalax galili]|uniref:histone H3-like centromeric protein A isoform X2 n=1 Tax=Nannospalax galili TaxID=1026970 RepID=UPI00111BF79A|nr:histone H3-like centromeric protein A isoform X2 [Nannospalax galili]